MELLTRLNAKAQSWTGLGGGYGGLEVSDICAALADTNDIGRLVLLFKHSGQVDKHDIKALHIKALKFAVKMGWKISKEDVKQERLKKLTKLCLIEYCIDPHCGTCKGTKYLYGKQCQYCNGTGQGHYKITHRAKILDVSRQTYQRKWEAKQRLLAGYYRTVLPEFEHRAKATVIKYLFSP